MTQRQAEKIARDIVWGQQGAWRHQSPITAGTIGVGFVTAYTTMVDGDALAEIIVDVLRTLQNRKGNK